MKCHRFALFRPDKTYNTTHVKSTIRVSVALENVMLTETRRADRFIHYVNTDEQLLADSPTFTLLRLAQGHGSLKECS